MLIMPIAVRRMLTITSQVFVQRILMTVVTTTMGTAILYLATVKLMDMDTLLTNVSAIRTVVDVTVIRKTRDLLLQILLRMDLQLFALMPASGKITQEVSLRRQVDVVVHSWMSTIAYKVSGVSRQVSSRRDSVITYSCYFQLWGMHSTMMTKMKMAIVEVEAAVVVVVKTMRTELAIGLSETSGLNIGACPDTVMLRWVITHAVF